MLSPIDILNGVRMDLSRRSTQRVILRLLETGQIWYVHIGVPCTVFSCARHGITNHRRAAEKERLGVELALFAYTVCSICKKLNIFWSIENPATSRLWNLDPIIELAMLHRVHAVTIEMCQYVMPFCKSTTVLTNCAALLGLARRCNHKRHDITLIGTVKQQGQYIKYTKLAAEYPQQLCVRWSKFLAGIAPR